jgi:O-antigen/teichoic acid export membrane protein
VIKRLMQSRFARDAGLLQLSGLFVAASALLSSVLLAEIILAGPQGDYFLAIMGYGLCYMLLGTGVQQAVVSQVAAARAREQWEKVAAWLAFAFKAQVAIGVLLFALGPIGVVPLVEFVTHDHAIAELAWWLCLSPIFEAPKTMATCALQGGRRMRALALMESGIEAVRLVCVVGAVLIEPTTRAAVIGTLVASALSGVIALIAHRREARRPGAYLPSVGAALARVRDVPLRSGLPLGMRMGILRSTDALAVNVLPGLILKHVGELRGLSDSSEWVAYFRVAQRIMQIPVVLLQGISRTALPGLSHAVGGRDPQRFKSLFFKVSALGGVLVAGGLALAYPVVLLVVKVYKPDYHDPVAGLAAILAIGLALTGFAGALDSFYVATSRLRVAIVISIVGIFVTMPVLAWLVHHDPRYGVAWGLVAVQSWVLVHYAYIAFYFRSGRHHADLRAPAVATAEEAT